jgi:CubicO group peptidase (beta-lactamase class C family)
MERRIDRAGISRFLDEMVETGVVSAAVALIGEPDQVLWASSAGWMRGRGEAGVRSRVSTRFDLASLTKPLTATLALALDADGTLPLETTVGEIWPEMVHPDLADRPLSDLLRHRAGLAAWAPFYHLCRTRGQVLGRLLSGEHLGARPGTYSDLGPLLYGMAAEQRTGEDLARLLRARVLAHPLWLSGVVPSPGPRADVAECTMHTGKEIELAAGLGIAIANQGPPATGWPQDGNARFLVGLRGGAGRRSQTEGHAGLFGRAQDLWRLGAEWLEPRRLLKPETVQAALGGDGPFALGWERATSPRGQASAGPDLSAASFGHTGFAGGSLWIDPEARRILVLLTHRTDPGNDMNSWRRRFHTLVQTSALRRSKKRAPTEATL